MDCVKGFKIKIPPNLELVAKINVPPDSPSHILHWFSDATGDLWLLVGIKEEKRFSSPDAVYGWTVVTSLVPFIPSDLQIIITEYGLVVSDYDDHYLIRPPDPHDPNSFLRPSRITFTDHSTKTLVKGDAKKEVYLDYGHANSLDLSSEQEITGQRYWHVLFSDQEVGRTETSYLRRIKFPTMATLFSVREEIPQLSNQFTVWLHPAAVVTFSALQTERKNPASYWAYLPSDLVTHYLYPMTIRRDADSK